VEQGQVNRKLMIGRVRAALPWQCRSIGVTLPGSAWFFFGTVQGICSLMLLIFFSVLKRPVCLLSLRFWNSVGSSYKLENV